MAKVETLALKGLLLITPEVYPDERGYFFESYNSQQLAAAGLNEIFVQDNESLSNKGVIRGLHFQNPPHAQGKLIRVIKGAVLDIAVDIRKSSPTYKKHFAIELNDSNKLLLYIPPGFAHGFITIADATIFQYKCTNYWNKNSESGIVYNDVELNIDWIVKNPILSEKDKMLPSLSNSINFFE